MPLTQQQIDQLFSILESVGWFWENNILYAPNKTYWLNRDIPWYGDFYDFRNRSLGKLHRMISRNKYSCDPDLKIILGDFSLLANTLEQMSEDGGLEAFFAKFSHPLESFSKQYNLRLTKYYCGNPAWDFTFRHPKGGVGKIEVAKETQDSVRIFLHWWIDDYDRSARLFKFARSNVVKLDEPNFELKLEKSLKMILSWNKEDCKSSTKPLENCTKEEIEKQEGYYPILKSI